jgi:DNA-binding response OmpR family regulator
MSNLPNGNVIMVVDPCPNDYEPLVAAGEANGVHFTFLSTGEQAVRSRGPPSGALAWMINMQLPCLTGLELYELMRSRLANVPVLMVDDQYDAERELSVLTTGRLHYMCKPLEPSWIDKLRRDNTEETG